MITFLKNGTKNFYNFRPHRTHVLTYTLSYLILTRFIWDRYYPSCSGAETWAQVKQLSWGRTVGKLQVQGFMWVCPEVRAFYPLLSSFWSNTSFPGKILLTRLGYVLHNVCPFFHSPYHNYLIAKVNAIITFQPPWMKLFYLQHRGQCV